MNDTERVPRCMSTQHPDNVTVPFFAGSAVMSGEDEIREAYYAFSHLGCEEQLWDFEGKEVDEFAVEKLLTTYEAFFKTNPLGRTVRLTPRVPNPAVERTQAKILLEVLQSLPRSYDVARHFYGEEIAPIFEVILPMTTQAAELTRILRYYEDFVVGRDDALIGDLTLREWIGDFHPKRIQVIPLIEDKPYLMTADAIVRDYLRDRAEPLQRVFLARSDPALNYGALSATLLVLVALARLDRLEREIGVSIYPIIGVGGPPFRGNFRPDNVAQCLSVYPSVQTYTLQSAFKYDHPASAVIQAVETLKATPRKAVVPIEPESRAQSIIERVSRHYQAQVATLVPVINLLAPHIPRRRMRKLHIGLFGYSRAVGAHALPRAIPFCASLDSVGLPPELLGLTALETADWRWLVDLCPALATDFKDACRYLNPEAFELLPAETATALRTALARLDIEVLVSQEHREVSRAVLQHLSDGRLDGMGQLILQAASLRRFLG